MGMILRGKNLVLQYKNEIRELISRKVNEGKRPPALVSIIVGDDGGSIYYTLGQKKVSEELGILYDMKIFPTEITDKELLSEIEKLNKDKSIDGIILQLPIPNHLDEHKIVEAIDVEKDVDGLTEYNTGRFYKGRECFVPCTAKSILELIKSQLVDIAGKRVVIIGRSNIVGKPAAQLFLNENATVTICHSKTVDLKNICKEADILVAAVGKPGLVTSEFVKEGAIVIDVGTTMVEGKVKGDVNLDNVIEKAKLVSPVPGGVGSMTTTMLMKNTCEAWLRNVQ